MNGPFLIRMDEATFAEIPNKAVPRTVRLEDPALQSRRATEWIFTGFCERLIDNNEKLQEFLRQFVGRLDAPECWNQLTQGQRILCSLAALDGEVRNGGITQFFWNCPDMIFPAGESLTALNCSDLSINYEEAVDSLVGNQESWLELRKKASDDPANFWEPFQSTYDLLDLNWFDDAYFEQFGPVLIDLLVNYVKENKAQFTEL